MAWTGCSDADCDGKLAWTANGATSFVHAPDYMGAAQLTNDDGQGAIVTDTGDFVMANDSDEMAVVCQCPAVGEYESQLKLHTQYGINYTHECTFLMHFSRFLINKLSQYS